MEAANKQGRIGRSSEKKKPHKDDDIEVGSRGSEVESRSPSTVTALLSEFATTTTAHGIPNIYSARSIIEKIFWTLAFLVCLGVFLWQSQTLIAEYLSFPYTTRTDIITSSSLLFPAITICNVNMMRRSMMINTRFEGLLKLDESLTGTDYDYSEWFSSQFFQDMGGEESPAVSASGPPATSAQTSSATQGGSSESPDYSPDSSSQLHELFSFVGSSWDTSQFDFYTYDWQGVQGSSDWQGIVEQSRDPDFYDVRSLLNPSLDELREYGHQPEDLILQCSFDRRNCSYKNFTMWQHGDYGNCFTFNGANPADKAKIARKTGRTGAQYGLHLTLFVEQPEYIGLLSTDSGVKVSIHPPTVQPFPEDDGITVSTGQKTSISLREVNITRLGGRYGDPCTRDGTNTNFTEMAEFSYSNRACYKMCLQKTLLDRCKCITDIRLINTTQCTSLNSTQERCLQLVLYLYETNTLECACPISCSEIMYRPNAFAALWPAERYEEHLALQLIKINEKAARTLNNTELSRKNLVNLIVYFEELNYELNLQVATNSIASLLGNLGGILGLYIGMSFMSIGEIILLFGCILQILAKRIRRQPTSPTEEAKESPRADAADEEQSKRDNCRRVLIALIVAVLLLIIAAVVCLVVLFVRGTIVFAF
ncbi:epithelial sodium channel subunit alpha-like [Diadema setosum]|uniref:epithelial sodium channel subunit alpha-like n=1 Tax=Diadema setosum TaxID=31175 RepID=UPI003B3B8469